jgi:hypothetical protein
MAILAYTALVLMTGISSAGIGIGVATNYFPACRNLAAIIVSGSLDLFILIAVFHK